MTSYTSIKKKISEDWNIAFPQLSLYSDSKLYKTVGPVLIGIEMIKLPSIESYSPHFVIYSLYGNKMGNDIKACMCGPIFLFEYSDKKGFQFDIPYAKHSIFFKEAVQSVKDQTPLPFDGNISLRVMEIALDNYSKTSPLSAAPTSFLQAALLAEKLKIALYISKAEAQKIFDQISKRSWDLIHFKNCGVDLKEWLESLQTTIDNRESFLAQIEINKNDKKIAKLKSSELIQNRNFFHTFFSDL